jgi:hypothetical protein
MVEVHRLLCWDWWDERDREGEIRITIKIKIRIKNEMNGQFVLDDR